MFELCLLVIVFIALSGLMAAVEAAVMNISPAEIEELRRKRAWGSEALKSITERMPQPVAIMVIFTNTINILGPILAGRKAIQLYGDVSIGMITAVLTLATILFSEIIPKSLGSHYAPLISRWAAPVIRALVVAFYPVVIALEWLSNLFKSGERRIGTESQIRSLTAMGHGEGYIERDESQLVHRAFLLNDRSAADIMTPLSKVVAIGDSSTIREAAACVFQHAFSRYPVFGQSPDNVAGLVLSRDILAALAHGRDAEPVSNIRREILIVPAAMSSDALLVLFRDRHAHLAVVRDQKKTVGLVTLEDVLEELVGEIEDEKDVSRPT
jgi:CBS domain containing-hemolysin-like protein